MLRASCTLHFVFMPQRVSFERRGLIPNTNTSGSGEPLRARKAEHEGGKKGNERSRVSEGAVSAGKDRVSKCLPKLLASIGLQLHRSAAFAGQFENGPW